MLTIGLMAFGTVLLFIVLGFPIAFLASRQMPPFVNGAILLALSLVCGLGLSAISASLSYGLFGLRSYLTFFGSLSLLAWLLLLINRKSLNWKLLLQGWKRSDLGLLIPLVFILFFSRSNWTSINSPQLSSGPGPDTAQNIMAAQFASEKASTWFNDSKSFLEYFGSNNLSEGMLELFRLPSFRDQAGIDYLVFGTRWGLTVPFSQLLKFTGAGGVLYETGFVLVFSLLGALIVTFAISKILIKSVYVQHLLVLSIVSSTPFHYQYFNGGLSQAWALSSNFGLFLIVYMVLKDQKLVDGHRNNSYILLFSLGWAGSTVTYIDSSIVISLFIVTFSMILRLKKSKLANVLFTHSLIGGLLAAILVPLFTWATAASFALRIKAATGTGIPANVWPLPSELLGFVNVFTSPSQNRSAETSLVGIILTIYIAWKVLGGVVKKAANMHVFVASISAILIMCLGFFLSITGKLGTNYIYLKVSTYVAPIVVIALFVALDEQKSQKLQLSRFRFTATLLTLLVLSSAVTAQLDINRDGTKIPGQYKVLIENSGVQEFLRSNNFLAPYLASSNLLGVIGDIHWISKAPNDILLKERLNTPLYLICYATDPSCRPSTKKIEVTELNNFSISVYEAPFTTELFMRASPRDRFTLNFEAFGQTPMQIPDRFIGGNPYFKD